MLKRKCALVKRGISAVIAATLATTLMPAAGLAFATEEASSALQSVQQEQANQDAQEPESAAAEDAAAADDAPVSGQGSEAAPQEPTAEEVAAEVPAASGKASYTTASTDRISADVPATAESVTVGDIEYNGLTYRINPDGATAALIGLGSGTVPAALSIPSRITSGGAVYDVTSILGTEFAGGGKG